jgi:hypothetical protein
MIKVQCPIEGWEAVSVSYPADDEWTMRHVSRYEVGTDRAWIPFRESAKKDGDKGDLELLPTVNEMALFGVLALCEIEGFTIDLKTLTLPQLWALPPYYAPVLSWIVNTVGGAYHRSKSAPKNSLPPLTTS